MEPWRIWQRGCRSTDRTAFRAATSCFLLKPAPELRRPGEMSDANIAAIVLAENYTDISYAGLAPARADRQDVKEFAQRMYTDHTGVNQLVKDLLAKLGV